MLRQLLIPALLLGQTLSAHDLEENRATLVMRDRTHLSVTLYLNYSEVLHKVLLPNREFGVFLLTYSAMKLEDLQRELQKAQIKLEEGVEIVPKSPTGSKLKLSGWKWPDAKQVQSMLQHQVMQAMIDGHVHEPPTEIAADAIAQYAISSITVRFPEEFRKVLVVSYRPNQVWVEGKQPSTSITF
ncbi:MAG: hypothetical protein RL328_2371 [Acidobacteriota bacterium]|jgi:hypothetical protein